MSYQGSRFERPTTFKKISFNASRSPFQSNAPNLASSRSSTVSRHTIQSPSETNTLSSNDDNQNPMNGHEGSRAKRRKRSDSTYVPDTPTTSNTSVYTTTPIPDVLPSTMTSSNRPVRKRKIPRSVSPPRTQRKSTYKIVGRERKLRSRVVPAADEEDGDTGENNLQSDGSNEPSQQQHNLDESDENAHNRGDSNQSSSDANDQEHIVETSPWNSLSLDQTTFPFSPSMHDQTASPSPQSSTEPDHINTANGASARSSVVLTTSEFHDENQINTTNIAEISEDDCVILEDDEIPKSSSVLPINENKESMTIDIKPETTEMVQSDSVYSFETPSSRQLKDICQRFNITFNIEALKMIWTLINYETFGKFSNKIQCHKFKSKNIFELFSLLLTFTTENCSEIQYIINQEFRDHLINSRTMSRREIDNFFMTTNTISNAHLDFIAKFLPCKIAIFEKSNLCRYGSWDDESDVLTFVFYFDGEYSIIMDL